MAVTAAGAADTFVTGRLDGLWWTVMWQPLRYYFVEDVTEGPTPTPAMMVSLFTVLALKTWMLRQVFTLPPRGARPADRRVFLAAIVLETGSSMTTGR